jgi:hypothetical protein
LEKISQQLLENKHSLTLGELFKIAPNLKQYVAMNIAFGRKNIIVVGPNPVIALVAIDPHMTMIHVQVGKNMVKDVLLNREFGVNIMMK